jgi:mRNA-degrading endonuclease YafQ of YafQ-DinJ toxin-antitoxin module
VVRKARNMSVKLDPDLYRKLKSLDVRIRNSFKKRILIFQKNPNDLRLNNHKLRDPYRGLHSINITNDYRAIYEEIKEGKETVSYFLLLGTHNELYGKSENS